MTLPASEAEIEVPSAPVEDDSVVKVAGRSPTQLAIARFRADKLSMISLTFTVLVALCAILAPILVSLDVLNPYKYNQDLLTEDGVTPLGRLGGISWDHPFGVEPGTGRDLLSRLMLAITSSLAIALIATVITVVIGTVLGIIAGFSGGWVDSLVGRFIDLVLSFPQTMMLLALAAPTVLVIRNDLSSVPGLGVLESRDLANGLFVIIILAVFGWPPVARVVRGQVLSIREREFIDAAKLLGASRRRLYFKEVLPNVWAPVLVYVTLLVPAFISAEAAFSFLGVGIKPPTPTLGNILRNSVDYTSADPMYFFLPGVLLALIVVVFNLVGDGARDALDPKAHR
ncbi:ABC transporter permease [Nocardioides sp. zg-536]|uniref:ABC transporter permease n=1 Tax=Nocardioides faecalis TaxID=2803858 RepID=A0A938Y6K3_9ACTN|nr:ABC transporter permease [Nocardioides faecalis]MBM9458805.1 ABC transporter permease [Nocardioides faecalis]MBS4754102.1 ABC transporter permease [Nocardioides faecalis]QVI60219.1 ABC transporter permease [Nocardioides faecalis]